MVRGCISVLDKSKPIDTRVKHVKWVYNPAVAFWKEMSERRYLLKREKWQQISFIDKSLNYYRPLYVYIYLVNIQNLYACGYIDLGSRGGWIVVMHNILHLNAHRPANKSITRAFCLKRVVGNTTPNLGQQNNRLLT